MQPAQIYSMRFSTAGATECLNTLNCKPRGHTLSFPMRAQVREFWHELESATNARQAAMFGLLNGHLNRLGGRVEAAVGGLLHVRLEPAALHLEPPSAQQHHADLQALFDSGERPVFCTDVGCDRRWPAPHLACLPCRHKSCAVGPWDPCIRDKASGTVRVVVLSRRKC